MSLTIVDGKMVTGFVEDRKDFEACVKECFEMLDVDGDKVLTRDELRQGFCKLLGLPKNKEEAAETNGDVYDMIFERFNEKKNGKIDFDEFRCLTREIMLAMARGIGNTPVLVALDIDSLLMRAVEHDQLGRK